MVSRVVECAKHEIIASLRERFDSGPIKVEDYDVSELQSTLPLNRDFGVSAEKAERFEKPTSVSTESGAGRSECPLTLVFASGERSCPTSSMAETTRVPVEKVHLLYRQSYAN